ncbi:hypothetical protein [Variovorax sp. MHTC-1]|uniref:hypothetical protein n=1 Tax=Variovorax sp. MHTC-1 TaxID=2495593 RepID=UPI00163D27CD|nr:hypothetical protein [Variovorax sp. MHTC-1]
MTGNVMIEDESDLAVLRQWTRAATGQGATIWAQLNHPGKQSPERIVEASARAIRRCGYDGIGIADIMNLFEAAGGQRIN